MEVGVGSDVECCGTGAEVGVCVGFGLGLLVTGVGVGLMGDSVGDTGGGVGVVGGFVKGSVGRGTGGPVGRGAGGGVGLKQLEGGLEERSHIFPWIQEYCVLKRVYPTNIRSSQSLVFPQETIPT